MVAENRLGQPVRESHDQQRQDPADNFAMGLPAALLAGQPASVAAQNAALPARTAENRALAGAGERCGAVGLRSRSGSGRVSQAGERIRRYIRAWIAQLRAPDAGPSTPAADGEPGNLPQDSARGGAGR